MDKNEAKSKELENNVLSIENVLLRDNNTLPDPYLVNYYQFASDRKIWLDQDIDEESMDVVRNIMLWNTQDKGLPAEDRKPIFVYMMSLGGYLDYGMAIVDAITTSETPVVTVNMGFCQSAAAYIFISGHRRYMMPGSSVMLHEGSAIIKGDAVEVLDASREYDIVLKKCRDFICAHTKISPRTLSAKRGNDWTLDSAACLENGVCDQVVCKLSEVL